MATTEQDIERTDPTIVPVDLDSIPSIQREGKSQRVVEAFLAGDAQAVQVEGGTKGFSASLKRYIKNAGLKGRVEVLNRGGNTYLRYESDSDEAE